MTNGKAAGAVLLNMETGEVLVARAKTRGHRHRRRGHGMHYQGFPTSNHYGATADGLMLGYRAGAKLLYAGHAAVSSHRRGVSRSRFTARW